MKSIVILITRPAIGNGLYKEAVDTIVSMAIFNLSVKVGFVQDGVFQLLNGFTNSSAGVDTNESNRDRRNIQKRQSTTFEELKEYGVEELFVDQQSAALRNIEVSQFPQIITWADTKDFKKRLSEADHILTF